MYIQLDILFYYYQTHFDVNDPKIQIKLRLLLDLKQLSIKQWFYISGLLETIKNNLGLESAYLRMSRECLLESGSLPSTETAEEV